MIAAEASVKHEKPAAFSLSDNQINEILRTGGGMEDSRKRIYAKYQEHKSPAEMAEFLKVEYRTTGKGFTFGEDPVSVWFDENGMKAGFGTSAKVNTVLEMSWAEIESHIRGMVEDGTYMNRNEAFLVDQTERQRVANHIYFFFRDGLDEMPESLGIAGNNFPDGEAHLMDMLATSEGRNAIATELSKAKDALDRGETELRWRYIKSPEYLLDEVADLDTEKMELLISNRRVSLRRMRSTLFLQAAVEYPEESSVSMNTFSRDTTARIILPFLKMNTGPAAGHMLLSVMIRAGRIMMQRG